MLNTIVQSVLLNQTGFNSHEFDFSKAPFTSPGFVFSTVTCYLSLLLVLVAFMADKEPLKLSKIFYVHNYLLCSVSLALLSLIAPLALQDWRNEGLFHALCSLDDKHLNFLYYINYLTKFWELGDTVFMALKKKDLPFLHVFHHSATFVLTWTQLAGNTSVQWVPICLNLIVHVIMYAYYAEASRGKKFWWKKYLTTLQIIQFIVDLGVIYYTMYHSLKGDCRIESWAGWLGTALISSYLILFIQFFQKTYTPKSGAKISRGGRGIDDKIAASRTSVSQKAAFLKEE